MVEISDLIQELKWYRYSTIPDLQPEYIDEIMDLLELHIPHVLPVNEIKAHEFVWLEDKGKREVIPALACERGATNYTFAVVQRFIRPRLDEYGVRWRAWSCHPTDAQREAEPWMG